MSNGPVKPFVDYSTGTGGDSGENDPKSIQPILVGEDVDGADPGVGFGGVDNRTSENLRQRSEALRGVIDDTLYLRDSDRVLLIGGPGKVTWPGSTTAAASGIPTIDDNLYIVPALTPGAAQAAPIPPVASVFGKLELAKAGGGNGIDVVSMRRSYDGGDKINIQVVAGVALTVTASDSPKRTVVITAPAGTLLNAVITALNALTADSPATQLVNATVSAGANGAVDTLAVPQAKQYISGNYDGEGHAVTPAALAAFFAGSPGSALAEGDSLCIQYANMNDTGLGGRRQSLPENSNTSIPTGSFFNSRVNPEKLVNAIPICKVINGGLVFINGTALVAGEVSPIAGGGAPATTTTLGTVKLAAAPESATAPVVFNQDANRALTVAAKAASNAAAINGTGDGTGAGAVLAGGGTGGDGVTAAGGGAGNGVHATGGPTNGAGVVARGQGSAPGVDAAGLGTGAGILAVGGTNGDGVDGAGNGSGAGVRGTGGATGPGGVFVAGGGGAPAIETTGDVSATGNVIASAAVAGSSAVFDGAGGTAGVVVPGAVTVTSTAATGTSAPTPAFHKGTVYKDTAVLAWGVVSGGALVCGVNVASVSHPGAGVYDIALNVGASALAKLCPVASASGENITAAVQVTAADTFTVITAHGEVAPSAGRINTDFFFIVMGG